MKPAILGLAQPLRCTRPTRSWATLLVAALLACQCMAKKAEASLIITVQEQGGNVVATGSGTIDLSGLTLTAGGDAGDANLESRLALLTFGSTGTPVYGYSGASGPTAWGVGYGVDATTTTGDAIGIFGADPAFGPSLSVPAGYVSGAALAATDTFPGQTFASMGLTPGTYTYTWGSGPTADSLTVDVGGAAVPEPTSILVLLTGGAGFLGYGRVGRGKTSKSQGSVLSAHSPAD